MRSILGVSRRLGCSAMLCCELCIGSHGGERERDVVAAGG
jgi:hypothetical protein